ncbi:uncharacterized protein LOC119072810 [Bradysia coprophila]|uniref:uncharacterized protein LOC119072810 n=1 Tax=Bradysia coprophila TaxID=38358 RepID=UPI00187D7954|nr:uncharacterized protein LOC119072810 [Bradysia coprophila]
MARLVIGLILLVVGIIAKEVPVFETVKDQLDDIQDDIPKDIPEIDDVEIIPSNGCTIAVNGGLPEPQPLLLRPNTLNFFNPDRNGIITLAENQQIELFCSGSFVAPFTNTRTLFATCQGGSFVVSGAARVFNTLACTGQVAHLARRTGQRCFDGSTHSEVGFDLGGGRFLVTHNVCHDEVAEATRYVYYEMTPSNMGWQRSFPRPSFVTGDYFGRRNVDNLYTQVTQRRTLSGILGEEVVDRLYSLHANAFLARGHLMANTDNIYGSQMRASFYFINAQPQFQVFNAGNWESVESGMKQFIANQNLNVEVYTGVHGILSLRDQHNVFRPLFLDFDANGRGLIPVPEFYYRVVLHRPTNRGIVFIGINNPHATEQDIQTRHIHCTDVSHFVNWVPWSSPGRTSILRGYSYACSVADFRRVVTNLPPHVTAGSLLF